MRVADLFCGAGGTSAGAAEAILALGRRVDLTAINHWPVAVATHTENHPEARHLCTNIDNVNPRELFKEGELDLLWASPECTHHSVARGGKPINDQSRATAWCVIRWAEALRPKVILVENVPEFVSWGGIGVDGRPLQSKRGETFLAWTAALMSLGYQVEHRVLCAADYGDPTTRRRLFVQAVRGRRRCVWPNPTHATKGVSGLKPWRTAREIIDWSLPGASVFDRERPLSEKTMRRIMAGLEKFGMKPFITPGNGERADQSPRTHSTEAPVPTVTAQGHLHLVNPFLVAMEHGGHERSIDRPINTITTAKGGAHALIEPFMVELRGTEESQINGSGRSLDDPTPTITAGGGHLAVVKPFLVHLAHGASGDDSSRSRSIENPLPTICGNRGDMALCQPEIQPLMIPQQSGGIARAVDEPVPTVASAGAIGLAQPYLIEYYGNGRAQSVDDPLGTATTKQRFGLARPVVTWEGRRYLLDINFRMLQPHELAGAQGFPSHYKFTGTKTDQVKQIGNAVPRRLARAIVLAALSQSPDIRRFLPSERGVS